MNATPPSPVHQPEAQPAPQALPEPRSLRWHPILVTAVVSAVAAGLSWGLPAKHSGSAVGMFFLGITWFLVLRHRQVPAEEYGLALGGLFSAEPIDYGKLAKAAAIALAAALLCAVLLLPPYAAAFPLYFGLKKRFYLASPPDLWNRIGSQIFMIALPEEVFFRGYLQSSLDKRFPKRVRFLGAELGVSVLITSALFAIGHVLTQPNPARLAVFFPSLLFGYLRARTGGIAAGTLFHASCNLTVMVLTYGYGFWH